MSYHVTNDLFPHRTSHAIIGSSSIEGSGLVLAGSGVALAGAGFGKGTRKKVLKTVGKVARAGLGLAKAFGTPEQQAKAQQAETAYGIVKGAGCAMPKPAAKLRKMMS